MLLKHTNIEEKLTSTRIDTLTSKNLLEEVYQILTQDTPKQQQITENIKKTGATTINQFDFDLLETQKIYHIEQIKKICIDYRLRFLDSKYFKSEIPQEAFSKIKKLEQEHNIEVTGFKIIAPSKLFKLKDKDDPLLFASIGNGYFYLIHKWGNDLHPLRKLMMWPFKSIVNLAVLLVILSFIITAFVPEGLFSKSGTNAQFIILFFFMFKSTVAIAIFYGFALGKNFNPAIWNSKYINT